MCRNGVFIWFMYKLDGGQRGNKLKFKSVIHKLYDLFEFTCRTLNILTINKTTSATGECRLLILCSRSNEFKGRNKSTVWPSRFFSYLSSLFRRYGKCSVVPS